MGNRVPVETLRCRSCGWGILVNDDSGGWKGIQMRPNDADIHHFCPKEVCVEARDRAIEKATAAWNAQGETTDE